MKSDFYTAIAQIAAERGIPREAVLSSVEHALQSVKAGRVPYADRPADVVLCHAAEKLKTRRKLPGLLTYYYGVPCCAVADRVYHSEVHDSLLLLWTRRLSRRCLHGR